MLEGKQSETVPAMTEVIDAGHDKGNGSNGANKLSSQSEMQDSLEARIQERANSRRALLRLRGELMLLERELQVPKKVDNEKKELRQQIQSLIERIHELEDTDEKVSEVIQRMQDQA